MNETELSPLEKQIAKKIKSTKPKSERKGYLRKLVDSLYTHIENALSNGCEYDDIAESISETKIQITASTLKQYHLANRRQRKKDNRKNKAEELSKSDKKQLLDTYAPLPSDPIPSTRSNEIADDRSFTSNKKQAAIEKLFSRK